MVRMVDVAKEAGVSIKTVSRVLNNEPHVQDAMRQKVQRAVDLLGYVPSASARSLRSHRSYSIMLLIHDVRSMFVNNVQFGALQACQRLGYHLELSMMSSNTLDDKAALTKWFKEILPSSRPDGLVLVPPMANNPLVAEVLENLDVTVVRIGPNDVPASERSATVMIDDYQAAMDMTQDLIAMGHTRIAFIRGKEDQDATPRRHEGYVDALKRAGIEVDESLILPGLFTFEAGLEAGEAFLGMENPPTAVFASNDDMAGGVIMAAHKAGIAVPEELSVVGFDDSEIAIRTLPALTTIRQPLEEMGIAAIEALVAAAGGSKEPVQSQTLPYEFVRRQSSGTLSQVR